MLILAHRGASAIKPENTLSAFAKAIERNADGIELDVRLTIDNHLVVIHDETTGRTANKNLIVAQSSLLEIKSVRINDDHKIPTLHEVLEIMPEGKIVNIEIKCSNAEEKIVELISVYSNKIKFIVSSFDWRVLKKLKKINNNILIGVLFENDFDTAFNFAKSINAEYLNPDYKLLNEFNINQAHSAGMKICCYTVNEPSEKLRLVLLGVDILISDVV